MTTPKIARWSYQGATPGADSNTYTLFDSSALGMGTGGRANMGFARLTICISNNAAGTLKIYRSSANGTPSWTKVQADQTVSAAASGSSYELDLYVGDFYDVKLDFTNGGSSQSGWFVEGTLNDSPVKIT